MQGLTDTVWYRSGKLPLKWGLIQFLEEISSEYSLEGLVLKLKLQYFGHLMQAADSLEKTLVLGKIKGRRKRGQQRMKWLDSITDSTDMNLCKLQETVKDREAWRAAVQEIMKSRTRHSDWTATRSEKVRAVGEKVIAVTDFIFWAPKSLQMVTAATKLKDACSMEEKLWQT